MVTAGSLKKVQFYAALAMMLTALEAGAAELKLPLAEVQQELTQKTEEAFSRKLQECRDKAHEERSGTGYPVRIAEEKPVQGGAANPYPGERLTVM
ncbi:hypothetical protein SAMN04487965_0558 [Microbulbifer donghaiensis]|uniref:Uncharacterized protein n=1 Tax=Microbulbifer donghaiensis TaxID=494016 RepID=A0A1M4VZX0_9GAMM|nr:hypothetical protein [Microbulbifer donghaiensis]SHE74497.1 hypothetical protein SAMN04487965_0558 [Microbulbifer donghaiensis]